MKNKTKRKISSVTIRENDALQLGGWYAYFCSLISFSCKTVAMLYRIIWHASIYSLISIYPHSEFRQVLKIDVHIQNQCRQSN